MGTFFINAPKLICLTQAKADDFESFKSGNDSNADCYLCCFPCSNPAKFLVDDNLVTLHKGQFLLLPLNIHCILLSVESAPYAMKIESTSITALLYKESYFAEPGCPYILVDIEEDTALCGALFDQLIKEMQHERPSNQIITSILDCIFSFVSRAAIAVNQHEDGFVGQVKKYIESHFKENITLTDLSEYTNVSMYHLAHTFKEKVGVSPIHYAINCRMKYAEKMLVNSQMPILNIAYDSGYDNPNYFNMLFKKMYGTSPGQYRKQHKKR